MVGTYRIYLSSLIIKREIYSINLSRTSNRIKRGKNYAGFERTYFDKLDKKNNSNQRKSYYLIFSVLKCKLLFCDYFVNSIVYGG